MTFTPPPDPAPAAASSAPPAAVTTKRAAPRTLGVIALVLGAGTLLCGGIAAWMLALELMHMRLEATAATVSPAMTVVGTTCGVSALCISIAALITGRGRGFAIAGLHLAVFGLVAPFLAEVVFTILFLGSLGLMLFSGF